MARLEAICGLFGVNLADLPLTIWCLPGFDVGLAHIRDDGAWQPGPFYELLRTELERVGPCLLTLDTVSDIATLDENKRLPVNTLCKRVLGGLCQEFGATVLVNAHPSKAAMMDGTGYAGSTAWNNAVRNRLELLQPEASSSRRILKRAKANYGTRDEMELHLVGTTFVLPGAISDESEAEREMVFSAISAMLNGGVSVQRANGGGQKPRDVAKEVEKRSGRRLTKESVLAHLNALERDGRLGYFAGGNQRRGQRAGFYLPKPSEC